MKILRRDLLKALAAFVAAGPAVAQAVAAKLPSAPEATGFTPPSHPAEPEPAVFREPDDNSRDSVNDPATFHIPENGTDALPDLGISDLPKEIHDLREALWRGDVVAVEVRRLPWLKNCTEVMFFVPESAGRVGTDSATQSAARRVIAEQVPVSARCYGGTAWEVTFQRIPR
jgi:hypothetical protein